MNVRRSLRARTVTAIVLALAGLAVLAVPAAAATTKVVASGLDNPRGLATTAFGALVVAEQGSGEVNLVGLGLRYNLAQLPSGEEAGPVDVAVGGFGLGFLGDTYVLTGGLGEQFGKLLRVGPLGVREVADIAAYQTTDPDPSDTEGIPEESNPNGLALLGGGSVLVADAANNDLLHVTKRGEVSTVARFPVETVLMPEGFPGPPDFPPAGTPLPAESVPTAVAVGPDGAWYVSELKGFPFVPGSANIWRIEPGTTDATCPSAACTVYATGFTNIIDLAFGPDGTMYVLEIAKNGLLSDDPTGALWAVSGGSKTELAPGALLFPGGVAVGRNGSLYVTTGAVFGEGAGTIVKVSPA